MKKCPFCAEEIQDAAIKCKHCGSELETVAPIPAPTKEPTNSDKKALKFLGYFVLVLLGLAFWYVAIPAATAWYLYKKNTKLSSKAKVIITAIVTVVFLSLGAITIHEGRAPQLVILSPESGFTVQATSTAVTGTVDPVSSSLTVNGLDVSVDENGGFKYLAPLRAETNQLTFEAKNGSSKVTTNVRINRTFSDEEIAERDAAAEQAKAERDAARITAAKEKLEKELESFETPFDASAYRGDVLALQIEIALFAAWADIIEEYEIYEDVEVQALIAELRQNVVALQRKEFPLMRQNYAKTAGTLMWESNVDVETRGSTHKTLQLTGALFANNANKAEAQRTIQEVAEMFRFDQVNYKWFEYDDEFTYFELDTPDDGELVELN